MDWRIKASSLMEPNLPIFPKTSKALYKKALNGSEKTSRSELIRCEFCYLVVHKVCYGTSINKGTPWLCDRCQLKSLVAVSYYILN